MRIAFYAPLKPPDHAVPSGDRTVGRLLVTALELGGHEVQLASRLRSFDGGNPERQARLATIGQALADRFIRACRSTGWQPDLWFTYHLYHKAPDWIGPRVCAALRIPYVVAEASYAPKQAGGPWDLGHRAVAAALGQANLVLSLNPADIACVTPLLRSPERIVQLPPFIDTAPYRHEQTGTPDTHPDSARDGVAQLMCAAMLRHDQKLESYRVLANALRLVTDLPWRIVIAGFGPAEAEVRRLFYGLDERVTWVGEVAPARLRQLYAQADLFVWPAVKEAWGMVFLEAQAAGTPVVAGRSGGVPDVVEDGVTGLITPMGDARAFAEAMRTLILDADRRQRMGAAARARMIGRHDIRVAADALDRHVRRAVAGFGK